MIYRGIVGSRSHGIEINRSDTDICLIDRAFSTRRSAFANGENVFEWSVSSLPEVLSMDSPPWYVYQILFPEKFLEETPLSLYIDQNRNPIIKAKHPSV